MPAKHIMFVSSGAGVHGQCKYTYMTCKRSWNEDMTHTYLWAATIYMWCSYHNNGVATWFSYEISAAYIWMKSSSTQSVIYILRSEFASEPAHKKETFEKCPRPAIRLCHKNSSSKYSIKLPFSWWLSSGRFDDLFLMNSFARKWFDLCEAFCALFGNVVNVDESSGYRTHQFYFLLPRF